MPRVFGLFIGLVIGTDHFEGGGRCIGVGVAAGLGTVIRGSSGRLLGTVLPNIEHVGLLGNDLSVLLDCIVVEYSVEGSGWRN